MLKIGGHEKEGRKLGSGRSEEMKAGGLLKKEFFSDRFVSVMETHPRGLGSGRRKEMAPTFWWKQPLKHSFYAEIQIKAC